MKRDYYNEVSDLYEAENIGTESGMQQSSRTGNARRKAARRKARRKAGTRGVASILATALVETGSRMDDLIYEEFKGTGNMELFLDRRLSEKRIFPAIDLAKSGTRREDLLMNQDEMQAVWAMRRALGGRDNMEATEAILDNLQMTRDNQTFIEVIQKVRFK